MKVGVAALLLAAGQSKRMGQNKLLLPLDEKPLIRHCVDAFIDAGLIDIIVVLGPTGSTVEPVLAELPVAVVWNTLLQSDMAESVRTGLKVLPIRVTGVLVCPADHPLVSPSTIKKISGYHRSYPDKILIPACQGKKGHPTLFPRTILDEIHTAATLRDILHRDPERIVFLNVSDPGIHIDIDTPEDFHRITS